MILANMTNYKMTGRRIFIFIAAFLIITTILLLINTRSKFEMTQPTSLATKLSGLNCAFDDVFLWVKSEGMWDSRVVKVTDLKK